ncbi:hypothetical protein [Clostridium tyrobutyricum]|uniref:hypothetical protein n=1 Tax=Clostridium tyrobutyricum TaxID=1519 RepID=UPI001C3D6A2E|nr:hypothetical protein [Clostridium tyrobutyricum]MBV4437713.1 hypothetical protein [Clostridium tyrobutyricum]
MISSYPDYFAPMPMMPRGIPTIPGYSIGNIESPITRMEEDSNQADYDDNPNSSQSKDNNINESKNSDNTQQDNNSEDVSEDIENKDSKDSKDINIDKNLTRQQTGTTGTTEPAATGPTGTTGSTAFEMAPGSPVEQDTNYTQGYLRTQIGKRVRVTFLLGTGTLQDRTGILTDVGISYIIIRNEETNTRELADIYSIKFVSIFD